MSLSEASASRFHVLFSPLHPSPHPDSAIALLKDQEPGAFIIRDSHSFRGAYGLAMKVSSPPPTIMQQNKKGNTGFSSRASGLGGP